MRFDARRWPNAVTIGWLIAERMGMGVHCNKCARHVVVDPASRWRWSWTWNRGNHPHLEALNDYEISELAKGRRRPASGGLGAFGGVGELPTGLLACNLHQRFHNE